MPSFDRPTGRTDTVTLTFNYSGAAKSGGPLAGSGAHQVDYQFSALPSIQVSCMDGYLLYVSTGAADNGDGTYTFNVAENGAVVYTSTVAYGTQVSFTRSVTLTLHTEEWLNFSDNILHAEFYERLSVDITGTPTGAYAKRGARLKQIYGGNFQGGVKVPSFLVQCATGISAFAVDALHGSGAASIDWTCSRALPASIPANSITYVPSGGGASVVHSTSSSSCSSSGGGDTIFTDLGSARVTWCPMSTIQVTGDLMEYDIPWSGGAVNYELFDGQVPDDTSGSPFRYEVNKYSLDGYPGVGDFPPAPGSVYAAAGSAASRGFNQEFFDVITGPGSSPGFHYRRSTFAPISGGAGAPFALFPVGAAYNVWKVDHVSGRTVEDCSDVTKWSVGGEGFYGAVTLTQVGGAIRAVTGAQTGFINLHFGSTPLKVYAWRYMDALVRSVGSANVDLKLMMVGEPLSTGGGLGSDELVFNFQTGADGAWVTRRLDMLAPSVIYSNSELPVGAQKPYKQVRGGKQNFDPLPSGLGMGNDMLGPIQYSDANGDNVLGILIPPNSTIEFDNFAMATADAASVYQTLAPAVDDPNIWAWTDQRLSMIRKVSFMPDLYYVRDQLILQEANLWTVSPPGGGYPTSDPILSLDGCAKWLGGGNGWIWDGTSWASWIEKNDTGAGLTWQAQPCAFQVTIYPGMNSPVGAASGTLNLRFRTRGSSRVYGHVFELGAPVNNAEVRVYDNGVSTFGSPNKTVNTDVTGFYKVAMKPDISPGGTGYFYYITNFLIPYNAVYSRSELAGGSGTERNPPLIVYMEAWQPYGADLSPIHASFWLGVATPCGTMPWNLTDKYGNLHDVCVKNGNAIYFRSDAPVPPFAIANIEVTDTGDVMDPRMVRDYRDRLLMVFTRTR